MSANRSRFAALQMGHYAPILQLTLRGDRVKLATHLDDAEANGNPPLKAELTIEGRRN